MAEPALLICLVVLILFALVVLVLLVAHCVPVFPFGIEILLAPVQRNLHQVFFLDQSTHCWQQFMCYPCLLECSPPIPVDLHIVLFQEFGGGCRETICFSVFYYRWHQRSHISRWSFVWVWALEGFPLQLFQRLYCYTQRGLVGLLFRVVPFVSPSQNVPRQSWLFACSTPGKIISLGGILAIFKVPIRSHIFWFQCDFGTSTNLPLCTFWTTVGPSWYLHWFLEEDFLSAWLLLDAQIDL